MAPPRRRRITFEWAGEEFDVGEYAVPGPLFRVLQRAVCIVMDGGACGAAMAAAVPPGAPGATFLADLVDEAAREEAWASGEEARGVLVKLLGWMVENAEEVMGQAEMGAGAGAGKAAGDGDGAAGKAAGGGGHADRAGGHEDGDRPSGSLYSCVFAAKPGQMVVHVGWRGRQYHLSHQVVLDAATAAACADVVCITLRGREAAAVNGSHRGLNFPPDGPAPDAYITALLAAAPADDARWLAASGEPRHAQAFAAAHVAVAAYLAHIRHPAAAAAAAVSKGERVQEGYAGIKDVNGHSVVQLAWRGRTYHLSENVVLDAATAAACADVARITLRGREAATVKGSLRGLNFPPDGPAPNDYITALLAAAPADDARWLAAGSGEVRHTEAFAAAHAAVAAYLAHIGHASTAAAAAVSKGERVQTGHAGIRDVKGHSVVELRWRGRTYSSRLQVVLDEATAAACADVARITLRGREAAIVSGGFRGLNFPPDGPAPNDYITALLAAAPADDARWLAAGSGEVRHAEAFAAAHAAVAAYLGHVGHASAGVARERAVDAAAGGR
jgi:hypothetical protein